jgi:hypothetical protein
LLASDEATHGSGEHVAVVSVPRLHEDVPDTVYPELHVGWHVDPLARELEQSPTPPFVMGAEASHGFAEHVAAVSVPALHEDVPDTVYPELHVGWHVDPLASELVQLPTPPFVGAVDASHDGGGGGGGGGSVGGVGGGDGGRTPVTSTGVVLCGLVIPSPSCILSFFPQSHNFVWFWIAQV